MIYYPDRVGVPVMVQGYNVLFDKMGRAVETAVAEEPVIVGLGLFSMVVVLSVFSWGLFARQSELGVPCSPRVYFEGSYNVAQAA